jgi:hypothetical protein
MFGQEAIWDNHTNYWSLISLHALHAVGRLGDCMHMGDMHMGRARGAMVLGLGAGAMPQAQSGASGAIPVLQAQRSCRDERDPRDTSTRYTCILLSILLGSAGDACVEFKQNS